ncbi:MAG: cytidine deaminase [Oligoflexia bacterium]|nr:cytidine deaminase [Oligoflexia bacterium]
MPKTPRKQQKKVSASRRIPAALKDLWKAAATARAHSHSPYSGAKVGAAIRTSDGRIFAGCNVENSSYGGTVCAERGAIQTAVAAQGKIRIAEILVLTDASPAWPPCGLCRQVIAEFAGPGALIHACNPQGEYWSTSLAKLLPNAFTPAHLGR